FIESRCRNPIADLLDGFATDPFVVPGKRDSIDHIRSVRWLGTGEGHVMAIREGEVKQVHTVASVETEAEGDRVPEGENLARSSFRAGLEVARRSAGASGAARGAACTRRCVSGSADRLAASRLGAGRWGAGLGTG